MKIQLTKEILLKGTGSSNPDLNPFKSYDYIKQLLKSNRKIDEVDCNELFSLARDYDVMNFLKLDFPHIKFLYHDSNYYYELFLTKIFKGTGLLPHDYYNLLKHIPIGVEGTLQMVKRIQTRLLSLKISTPKPFYAVPANEIDPSNVVRNSKPKQILNFVTDYLKVTKDTSLTQDSYVEQIAKDAMVAINLGSLDHPRFFTAHDLIYFIDENNVPMIGAVDKWDITAIFEYTRPKVNGDIVSIPFEFPIEKFIPNNMKAFDSTGIFTSTMMERTSQWQFNKKILYNYWHHKKYSSDLYVPEKLGISKQKVIKHNFFDIHGPIGIVPHTSTTMLFSHGNELYEHIRLGGVTLHEDRY